MIRGVEIQRGSKRGRGRGRSTTAGVQLAVLVPVQWKGMERESRKEEGKGGQCDGGGDWATFLTEEVDCISAGSHDLFRQADVSQPVV